MSSVFDYGLWEEVSRHFDINKLSYQKFQYKRRGTVHFSYMPNEVDLTLPLFFDGHAKNLQYLAVLH
jgi:hypothetical protein